jgi:3'-phosphoadenosine 5'-phosphosulfate sulfotransferase (PAPS reductase)/FAD synthetase
MNNKRAQWLLHSKTEEFKRHLGYAKKDIQEARSIGLFVISWSTGKDSTAMCHLIKSMIPDTPVMIQFDDCDWPEKRPYAERLSRRYGWALHEVSPSFSVWETASKCKIGYEELCAQTHALTAFSFISLLENKRKELGCIGSFVGLRAEESKARKLNLSVRGELYQTKEGAWHCCPLGRWTVLDVFAYLVSNDIEINPCYFHNALKDPEEIRLSWALPTPNGIRKGDLEHIRRYYPKQFARLRDLGVHE